MLFKMNEVVESYEFYDYRPPTSVNINESGNDIPIIVYNEDLVTQPHKSVLVLTGKMTATKTGTSGTTAVNTFNLENVKTVNNGFLNFFERIDYYIGDNKIDTIRKPGIATTMKGLVSFENDKMFCDAGWKIFNDRVETVMDTAGKFQALIPMRIIMGFFEDYVKFLYRMPQKLIFYRSTDPDNDLVILSGTDTETYTVKFTLTDITWKMPQVKFAIEYETKVRDEILKNTNYELHFRHWMYTSTVVGGCTEYTWDVPVAYAKTKYVLLAFQNGRNKESRIDNSMFDFNQLENVQVLLNNNIYYPRERLNLNLSDNKCTILYNMFKEFKCSYYPDSDSLSSLPLITYKQFLEKYPVIAVDCSNQPNVIKESLISIKINFNWRAALPANTLVHCVMIIDDKAVYNPLNNRVIH